MLAKSTLILVGVTLINIFAMAEKFTPSDLIQLARPGIPVTSPSGALAVYAQSAYNSTDTKVLSLYLFLFFFIYFILTILYRLLEISTF